MIVFPMQPPNHQVETNRCQASRLRSWPVIRGCFCVCHGALAAAVAHLKRSARADSGVAGGIVASGCGEHFVTSDCADDAGVFIRAHPLHPWLDFWVS